MYRFSFSASRLLCILALVLSSTLFAQQFKAKVIAVKDGDTVVVLLEQKPVTVRLEHVDTPEKKQDYGTAARKFVSDFCFGKVVQVIGNGKRDRNGRIIAEIFYKNQNLGKELVRNGLAWHYKKYSKNSVYAELEIMARKKRKGLWKDENAVAPWLWRVKKKPAKALKPAA